MHARPRCCSPIPDEFAPCYSSVLLFGPSPDALQAAVGALEAAPLRSSFTAWCSACSAPYLITRVMDRFPTPSAHHAHMLALSTK